MIPAGGEIGAVNDFHNVFERVVGLLIESDGRFDDFGEIVRRNVGGHADGDAARTVDKQIRDARRQDVGLFRVSS